MSDTNQPLVLSDAEQAMLDGAGGEALRFAMELVVRAARIMGAPRLIEAGFLHIDACHYYGRAHVDFARYLVSANARFTLPAWTNTVPVSLRQEEVRDGASETFLAEARELAELYVDMGARPVWTCAPYQLPDGPGLGDQIIVGESNAVAYYNSAVGARTNKYGDFLDVAAGLVQRVPDAGLHRDEGRRGQIHVDITGLPDTLTRQEIFCHVLGTVLGRRCGSSIPVLDGLPGDTSADNLKALAAAGAAAGGIALFHAVGVTPEAASLEAAFQGRDPDATFVVSSENLISARDALSSAKPGPLAMVALGTPHFSFTEIARLAELMDGRRVHGDVRLYISTSRHVEALARNKGWIGQLESAGAHILVDTCTYFSPAVRGCRGRVMTNSAKWAYYAPGMLPVEVAFGSLEDCVESAVRGEVWRDQTLWSDAAWGRP